MFWSLLLGYIICLLISFCMLNYSSLHLNVVDQFIFIMSCFHFPKIYSKLQKLFGENNFVKRTMV